MQEIFRPSDQAAVPGDRRATRQALAHWMNSRREDANPTLMDLDLSAEQIVASNWFLLKVDEDPEHSVFIECGALAQDALARRPRGKTLLEVVPKAIQAALCGACAKAIEQRTPHGAEGAFQTGAGAEVRYRSIFMPLDANGHGGRGYVLGAYSAKQFANGRSNPDAPSSG
jgi:hypothetical protein